MSIHDPPLPHPRSASAGLPNLVFVDSRDPASAPLSQLLASARAHGVPMVTATLEQTLKAVASPSRAAVLIHMGVDPRPGGGGGCLLAIELRRRDPNLAIILYTGNLNARTPALDSLGSTIPIVADESLTSNLGVVLSVAVSVAERT